MRLGNHELLIRLAAGGAANVFLVRDLEHDNRLLALKILLPSLAQNEDFLNMFFTEAKIASHLRHPNIVTIAGFGQVDGIHCLAMEYVFGASLSQVLRASARAKKPLTVGVLLRLTASVCDALHYAHELTDESGESMGLVHRDVTPQNILIGFNGVPKLTDFGIAKATNRGWETQAGIVKGKFSYMSPEQALGKTVDRRSDIFGAGIVLWEALTGRDLFKGSTPMEVLSAIREQKIEPPSKVVPGLTPIVDPIVMKALRRSPKQRYATAAEMRDDIEELIHRAGVQIDAGAISQEFAQIYGDEIGKRALALKQAILGTGDLEGLATALGGTVLNPKQLPMMKGGVNDPDPLGLFTTGTGEFQSEEVSGAMPARLERSFSGEPPAEEVPPAEEIEIDEDDDDLLDIQEGGAHYVAGRDLPEVPDHRLLSGWDDSTSTSVPEDELLSMISEEDATVGFLPPQFAERFGRALEVALRAQETEDGFGHDRSAGALEAQLSKLRAISSAESFQGFEPSMLRAMAADLVHGSPVPSGALRPAPRAPSVLMEENAKRPDRFVPRAPSWDMDGGPDAGSAEAPSPSRPPLGAPPPPPRQTSMQGHPPVALKDEYPASSPTTRGVSPEAASLVEGPGAQTDRAPAPLPFGAYAYSRGSQKAWSTLVAASAPRLDPSPTPATDEEPSPSPWTNAAPSSSVPSPAPDWEDPSPIPEPRLVVNRSEAESAVGSARSSAPAVPRSASPAAPVSAPSTPRSPAPSTPVQARLLDDDDDGPPPKPSRPLLTPDGPVTPGRGLGAAGSLSGTGSFSGTGSLPGTAPPPSLSRPPPSATGDRGAPSSSRAGHGPLKSVSMVPPPKPPLQLSVVTLFAIGVILLIAGVALGALLGPQL